jgi:hypothetical protein
MQAHLCSRDEAYTHVQQERHPPMFAFASHVCATQTLPFKTWTLCIFLLNHTSSHCHQTLGLLPPSKLCLPPPRPAKPLCRRPSSVTAAV